MSRILFILVLLVVGFLMLKSWQRKQHLKQQNQNASGQIPKSTHMVRCEQCQLYVPEADAISQGGKHFCSLEHAKWHMTRS